jgi:hypothetical protein
MLTKPGVDFEGGNFVAPVAKNTRTESGINPSEHVFGKGDAIFFVSHKFHNILPVTSGKRIVLVAELWEGAEKESPHRCNSEGKWRMSAQRCDCVPALQ